MNEQLIVDNWILFKDHVDKKQLSLVAEEYLELLADYGVEDQTLKNVVGNCDYLDKAILYYFDDHADDDSDYE